MKPGMQRDILVAYWLLFDEFDIGDNDPPAQLDQPSRAARPAAVKDAEKPKPRSNGTKNRRRQ